MMTIKRTLYRLSAMLCCGLTYCFLSTPTFAQGVQQLESLKIPIKKQTDTGLTAQELLKQMEAVEQNDVQLAPSEKPIAVEPSPGRTPDVQVDTNGKSAPERKAIEKPIPQKTIKKTVSKKPAVSKTTKKNAPKVAQRTYIPSQLPPPLPALKPNEPAYVPQSIARIIDYTNIPEGVVITKDVALRIALEVAPPSRSFTVLDGRDYKGTTVYQVSFKTENGMHDVLVDAQNGKILKQ